MKLTEQTLSGNSFSTAPLQGRRRDSVQILRTLRVTAACNFNNLFPDSQVRRSVRAIRQSYSSTEWCWVRLITKRSISENPSDS